MFHQTAVLSPLDILQDSSACGKRGVCNASISIAIPKQMFTASGTQSKLSRNSIRAVGRMREASGFGRFSLNNLVLAVVSERREIRTYDCTRYAVRAPKGQVHVITMHISLLLTPMPHQLPTPPILTLFSHFSLSTREGGGVLRGRADQRAGKGSAKGPLQLYAGAQGQHGHERSCSCLDSAVSSVSSVCSVFPCMVVSSVSCSVLGTAKLRCQTYLGAFCRARSKGKDREQDQS